MISGRLSLARGRVTSPGEFLEMNNSDFRTLVARDAELSEIFMRAFILRRVELINRGFGNVILLGSRHSAQTLRLREFLTRNGHPHTYVDLDSDICSTTFKSLWKKFPLLFVTTELCFATRLFRNWRSALDSMPTLRRRK